MSQTLQELFEALSQSLADYEACLYHEKTLLEEHTLDDYPALLKDKESIVVRIQSCQTQLMLEKPEGMTPKCYVRQKSAQHTEVERASLQNHWNSLGRQLQLYEGLTQANGMVIQASKNITHYFIDLITKRDLNRTYSKHAITHASIESTQSKRV